ncbi:MAG TPA: hydantoinase/oxoprolinase family protein [Thermomicrobiales bacterium]|nr:hydantoinase/oxoprolinase family protein [Thermomicrobiales bacterium]
MAVEVGGTFTDLIWVDADGRVRAHKVPSSPGDPAVGVIAGLEEALGGRLRDLGVVFHGSTVATNAVLERKAGRAGLLTTRGFRDLLVTQRQLRPDIYSIVATKPAPIIPLARTAEVTERITVDGAVQTALDETDLIAAVDSLLRDQQLEALAVCFLHSYQDPCHELRAREVIRERAPDLPVVLSSEVLPTIREYERASTTAIAAALAPLVGRYLEHLEGYLREQEIRAPVFVMQSSGGVLPSAGTRARPVEMLQSGPAAGVIAAIRIAERRGDPDLITLDMGGTSTDVCLVRDGVAEVNAEREIGGLPVGIPSIDIANVGAGGGSIAWQDEGGMLRVGPRSAGARPGPASYGHGGTEPAITDAVVKLGWLRPHRFLGGRMALLPDRAEAVLRPLAGALGQPLTTAAQAIVDVGVAHINGAVRLVSTQRGHDPRSYALYAYGGMGPLVGALVAEEMGIRRVVVPPHPGLFSALGLLVADLERTYRQTSIARLADEAIPEVLAVFARLRADAEAEFAGYGYDPAQVEIATHLEMRYRGQGFELLVPVELDLVAREGVPYLARAFQNVHQARYSTRHPAGVVEVVTYRLVGRIPADRSVLDHLTDRSSDGQPEIEESRVTFRGESQPCTFLWRNSLPAGFRAQGLAIVEEATATTLVPPGWSLTVEASGALGLERETR